MTRSHFDVRYLIGGDDEPQDRRPFAPFSELTCDFLNALSKALRGDKSAALYPDVMAFAFWCRQGNIQRLRDEFNDGRARLGLGEVFHIAPSNVPVNFAFSYAFGLLAGNVNHVRVPSKDFAQIDVICRIVRETLVHSGFKPLRSASHFFRYGHQPEITSRISARCQGRLIWGGNETIREIRKSPIQIRGVEIAFADRYSICCLGAQDIASRSDTDLDRLVRGFYNDAYLMDQNACSSPHLVAWLGDEETAAIARKKFWETLGRVAQEKYELSSKAAIDKQILFCENAIELPHIRGADVRNASLFRVELGELPENLDALRGSCGYFYEYQTNDLDSIAKVVTPAYQTMTYAGVDKERLKDFVVGNRLSGIDRIVPVGAALDIGIVWDGHHVVQSLSRIIDIW